MSSERLLYQGILESGVIHARLSAEVARLQDWKSQIYIGILEGTPNRKLQLGKYYQSYVTHHLN
jgi:hypothetical protein